MNAFAPGRESDLDAIRLELKARTEDVALALRGEPNRRVSTRRKWRWGRKGSFCLDVSGPKRGLCIDRDAHEGGDLLWWIGREIGGAFPEALAWARDFLGMPEPLSRPATGAERAAREARRKALAEKRAQERARQEAEQASDEARRIAKARKLAAEAVPADGTPADVYLTKWRRIPRPAGGWPDAVRYHRGMHAVVLLLTAEAGEVQAVQTILLTPDAKKLPEEDAKARGFPATKFTRGPMAGAVVRLPGADGALPVAEGPETALSIWMATGMATWATCGPTNRIAPPRGATAILCADDDPRGPRKTDKVRTTRKAWREAGVRVHVARPWAVRRFDKSDFNDALREEGAAAVLARVAAALPQDAGPDTRLDVEDGRKKLGKAMEGFAEAAMAHGPEDPGAGTPVVIAIAADVGLGKSAASRRAIVRMVLDLRARRDPRRVFIAIPTHSLGDEQADAFEKMPEFADAGLAVRVWRGRRAPDPEDGDYTDDAIPKAEKTKMCLDLDAVEEVEKIGLPVHEHVCRSKKDECPLFDICGFQRQKEATADVWIGAHEMLFQEKPETLGGLAAVIVDEAAWQDGLEDVSGKPNDLALAAIGPDMAVPNDKTGKRTARLRELVRRLLAGLAAHGDGELRAGPLLEAGLDEDAAHEGVTLAWDCVVDPGIVPGMPAEKRRELARAAAGNRTAIRLAGVFARIKAMLDGHPFDASGWLELLHKDTDDGRVRVLRIRGRRPVRQGWRVPTLIIDALLDERLVKPFWPDVRVAARLRVKTPHTRFRQIIDRDFPQSALVPEEEKGDEEGRRRQRRENQRRLRRSRELRAAVLREARRTDGRVLVIAQKAVREYWESLGALPGNVEFGHCNAIAGIDRWGPQIDQEGNLVDPGVRLVVLAGRILPPAAAVETMARALTGLGLGGFAGGYLKSTAARRLLADGQTIPAETDWHPQEIAEAIRWQACEGELVQGGGRGRPANRTAANPLDVLIFTDRPMPFPVEPVSWGEMAPDWRDLMLAEGGVALMNGTHAAKAYPKIRGDSGDDAGITPNAIKLARWKQAGDRCTPAKCVSDPYREYPPGKGNPLRTTATISYQLRGRGQSPQSAEVDLALVPDPKAWLEARLGPVKWCTVDEDEPEPPSPPPSEPRPPAPPRPPTPPPSPPEEELEDAPALAALGLPLEVTVSPPPPPLLRRLAERAGGRAPPRVLVSEPLPLAAAPPAPGACGPPVSVAMH